MREKVSAKEWEMVATQAAAEAESEHVVGLKKRMELYQQLLQKGIATVQEKIERENEYHNSIALLNTHRINIARVKVELLQFEDELARSESQEKQPITDIQQQRTAVAELKETITDTRSSLLMEVFGMNSDEYNARWEAKALIYNDKYGADCWWSRDATLKDAKKNIPPFPAQTV